jgi:hypothetical protein
MPFCDGLMLDDAGLVKAETPGSAGCAGYAGFLENSNDTENLQLKIPLDLEKNQNCPVDSDKNPANPTNPALPRVLTNINPTQSGKNPSHPPEASSPPTAAKFKVGDRVQMRSDYITPQLCGQQAVVQKDSGDDKYQIDFGRKIETPFVEPKRFFVIDKKYFHHVTDGEQLKIPF